MRAFRGTVVHCLADPRETAARDAVQIFDDGMLVVDDGRIVAVGEADQIAAVHKGIDVEDHAGCLIVPGFIDSHVHFPQVDVIASHGEQFARLARALCVPGRKSICRRGVRASGRGLFSR